jgi:lysophospholipase L1-like esterase
MPYHSLSKEERKVVWDDGLHFTAEGYRRIGEMVGKMLAGILNDGEEDDDNEN